MQESLNEERIDENVETIGRNKKLKMKIEINCRVENMLNRTEIMTNRNNSYRKS